MNSRWLRRRAREVSKEVVAVCRSAVVEGRVGGREVRDWPEQSFTPWG